ncbi:hypothetical protein ACUODJ_55340, partial [Escherichia sp. HC-CC]
MLAKLTDQMPAASGLPAQAVQALFQGPKLRASDSPFAINWMGAPVGRTYDIERATSAKGP